MNKRYLHNWVFHYNQYTDLWNAARREDYNLLFSNLKSDRVLKSRRVETLTELIAKTNGEKIKIDKLLT